MKMDELKQLLGSRYRYDQWMSEGEVERLQREAPADFSDRPIASLAAGCVKIDAVLFRAGGQLRLGYDVFVKDVPGSSEWICYDSPEEDASLDEMRMFSVLDRVVTENGLSYTECCFEQLNGKTMKKEQSQQEGSALKL